MATVALVTILIVAGLDYRYSGLINLSILVAVLAIKFVLLYGALVNWAMAFNRYFMGVVRIIWIVTTNKLLTLDCTSTFDIRYTWVHC